MLGTDERGAAYLQGLLLLQDDPAIDIRIQARAASDEEKIYDENKTPPETNVDSSVEMRSLEEITSPARNELERVVLLLAEGQRNKVLSNYTDWYRGAGGITKPHGILSGNVRGRRSWSYAPENDLLAIFVQLAAARMLPPASIEEQRAPKPIRLQDFLKFLEDRFGILVDRPPDQFRGADYAAAARNNLQAMLRRLRQMGMFRDMSDDFTVQQLHPPYSEERIES